MPQLVDVEGIGQVEFPDHYTPAMIQDYWKQNFQPRLQQEQRIQAGLEASRRPEDTPNWDALKSTARQMVADPAIDIARGVVGVPETAVGLLDIPTMGYAGKALENIPYGPRFGETKQILGELYSPERKAAMEKVKEAKGFAPTIEAMVENPSTLVGTTLESLPSMFGGGALAQKGLSTLAKLGPRAAAFAAGETAPVVAGALGEGLVSAGQTAEQIREETPNRALTWDQAGLALASGALTGGIGVAAGKLAQKLGIENLHTLMAKGKSSTTAKDLGERIVKGIGGAITEGFFEELPQSTQEQITQNIALGKPWDEGVGEQAAAGLLAGAAMGGVAGAFGPGHHAPAGPKTPPPTAGPAPTTPSPVLPQAPAPAPQATPAAPATGAPPTRPSLPQGATQAQIGNAPQQESQSNNYWSEWQKGEPVPVKIENLSHFKNIFGLLTPEGQSQLISSMGLTAQDAQDLVSGKSTLTSLNAKLEFDLPRSYFSQDAMRSFWGAMRNRPEPAKPANRLTLTGDTKLPQATRSALASPQVGIDYASMSQDQWAKALSVNPSLADTRGQRGIYNALTLRPELRAKPYFSISSELAAKAYDLMDRIKSATGMIGSSTGWMYKNFGDSKTKNPDGTRSKAYLTVKNPIENLTPERMSELVRELEKSGYNGSVKTVQKAPFTAERLIKSFDNVVFHGKTQSDVDIAASIAQRIFGKAGSVSFGIDPVGTSHTDHLASLVAKSIGNRTELKIPERRISVQTAPIIRPEASMVAPQQAPLSIQRGPVVTPEIAAAAQQAVSGPSKSDLRLAAETNQQLNARVPVAERGKAIAERMAAALRIAATIQPGDIINGDAEDRLIVKEVLGDGSFWVEGENGNEFEFKFLPGHTVEKRGGIPELKRVENAREMIQGMRRLSLTNPKAAAQPEAIAVAPATPADREAQYEASTAKFSAALRAERSAYEQEVSKRPVEQQPPRLWYENEAAKRGIGPNELTGDEIRAYRQQWDNAVKAALAAGRPVYATLSDKPPKKGWVKRGEIWYPPERAQTSEKRLSLTNPQGKVEPVSIVTQTPTPKTFNSVEELLEFRRKRLAEEVKLYQQEIGLTKEEAEHLADLLARERSTDRFEKKLGAEKSARMNDFFDNSPLNKKGHPFEWWERDKRIDPEQIALETDPEVLASTIVSAVSRGVESSITSDRFIGAVIAALQMKKHGFTNSDLARYIDRLSTRESSSMGDKAEFAKTLTERVAAFLKSVGVELKPGDLFEESKKPQLEEKKAESVKAIAEPEYTVGSGVPYAGRIYRVLSVKGDKVHIQDSAVGGEKRWVSKGQLKLAQEMSRQQMPEEAPDELPIAPAQQFGRGDGFYITQKGLDIGEGPFNSRDEAAQFAESEVGGRVKIVEVIKGKLTGGPKRATVGHMIEATPATPASPTTPEPISALESPSAKADFVKVATALKRAYPFQGIKTGSDERAFLQKAKRLLAPLGVPKDVFDRAVESERRPGSVIVWASDNSILRGLLKQGWIKETPSAPPSTETPSPAPAEPGPQSIAQETALKPEEQRDEGNLGRFLKIFPDPLSVGDMAVSSDKSIRQNQRSILEKLYPDYKPTRHDAFVERYNYQLGQARLAVYEQNRGISQKEAVAPIPASQLTPAQRATAEGQKKMASEALAVSTVLLLNEKVRQKSPSEAWDAKQIHAATGNQSMLNSIRDDLLPIYNRLYAKPAPEAAAPVTTPEEKPTTPPQKPPAEMTASEINKRLDKLAKQSEQITDELIAAGRGSEKPSDYLKKNDPLSVRAQEVAKEISSLRNEIELRYGPNAPSRLPTRGFPPRVKPSPQTITGSTTETLPDGIKKMVDIEVGIGNHQMVLTQIPAEWDADVKEWLVTPAGHEWIDTIKLKRNYLDIQETAGEWIIEAIHSKKPPRSIEEAWSLYRKQNGVRQEPTLTKSDFAKRWEQIKPSDATKSGTEMPVPPPAAPLTQGREEGGEIQEPWMAAQARLNADDPIGAVNALKGLRLEALQEQLRKLGFSAVYNVPSAAKLLQRFESLAPQNTKSALQKSRLESRKRELVRLIEDQASNLKRHDEVVAGGGPEYAGLRPGETRQDAQRRLDGYKSELEILNKPSGSSPVVPPGEKLTTDAAIKAIEELQKKIKGKQFSDPSFSTVWGPFALNVAKYLLRMGRPLEVAIREAVEKVRQQFPASNIDPQQAEQAIQTELATENEVLNAAERTKINRLEVDAAAEAIPHMASQQYADLESGYGTLEQAAFEKQQFRKAKSDLATLVNLADGAIRKLPDDRRHPDLYPKVTDGVSVTNGRVTVDDTFSNKLAALGVQHNPDNVKAMQAELYFEQLARKAADARERLQDLQDRLAYYQKIKAPDADIKRLQDLIAKNTTAASNAEAVALERNGADVLVGERTNELQQAEAKRMEAQAKVDALHIGPVAEFFGAGIAKLRNLFEKAKASAALIEELRKTTTDPEKLKALADEYRRYGDLPITIEKAIAEDSPLNQRQQDAAAAELQKALAEFNDARDEMNALLQQEEHTIIQQIEEAQKSFSKSANSVQENEALVQSALNAAKGDPALAHSVLAAAEINSLLNNVTAIANLAKHLGENLTQNRWLYDFLSGWRSSPGGSVTFSNLDAASLNVSPEVLQKVIDVASSSPSFASSIVALADAAAAAKAASVPIRLAGTLPSISDALKQGGKKGIDTAAQIASQFSRAVNPAITASRADNRQAARQINSLLTRLMALHHGANLFNNLAQSPQFQTLRQNIIVGSGGAPQQMIDRRPTGFTFREFGEAGKTPAHGEVILNVSEDPSSMERARKKMFAWFSAAEKYVAAYDQAVWLHALDPKTSKSPAELGFNESVARGLAAEIDVGRGEFLDQTFNRLKTTDSARKLMKLPLFRQHDAASRMVGGLVGAAMRSSLGRWVQGMMDSKRVMARFEDLPDLTSKALHSHYDPKNPKDNSYLNYDTYRKQVWNPMAHEGRKFDSDLKVGFQLPTGAIVTKEDIALLERSLVLNGMQRTEVSETNPLRGVHVTVGGKTYIRPSSSVGVFGMDRHLNRNANAFVADSTVAYRDTPGFDSSTDLSSASSNPVVQFWNNRNQMLIDHVVDSDRTDRKMKLDPAMQDAEKRLAALWKAGLETKPSNLAELVSQLATTLNPMAGVNPVSYVTERLNSELLNYQKEAARIQQERNDESTKNTGLKIALSADNEFTKPAAQLELPSSLYDYGALTPGERIARQSSANHQNLVEYANSVRRAIEELQTRLKRYNDGKLSAKEAAENYGGNVSEMKDTLEILRAILKDFEAAFSVNDPSLAPTRLASEISKWAVSGVLALPTVNFRNMTGGQFLVYLSDIAMGITLNRLALWNAVANMPKGLARLAYVWANGTAKFVDKNLVRHGNALEKVVDVVADAALAPARMALKNPAISTAGWKAQLEQVKNLGYDTKQGWVDAMKAAWLQSALFTNREEQEWAARNPKLAAANRAALTAAKTINAFFGSIGVENSDQVLNSLNLASAAALEQRLVEVARQYGKRLEDSGHTVFDPSDPAFQLKPSEWTTGGNEQARDDALANARLLFQTSASAEGFQLEHALWKFYQDEKAGRPASIYTDRQREAVTRTLLAMMNASLPTNRASVGAGNPLWRSVLTLQGYPADAMMKLINVSFGGTRDRRVAATIGAKLPMLFGIAAMMVLAGAAADGASEYWKRRMQAIQSAQAGVLDKDFWENKDKMASGVGRFLASNMFYLGDFILGMQNQVQGGKGFDPASRVFLVSVVNALTQAVRESYATYSGAGPASHVVNPFIDFAARLTPGANEMRKIFGVNTLLQQSKNVSGAEERTLGIERPKTGAAPSAGPTTVARRFLASAVGEMEEARRKNDQVAYQKAFTKAQEEIGYLQEYYVKHRTELGDSPADAEKHAKQAVWRDYQEINPVIASMGGRRPTEAEYRSITSGPTGERAEVQQKGIEAWQAGAQALFGKTGATTKEEVASSRGGGVPANLSVPATGSGGGGGSTGTISTGRGAPSRLRSVRLGRLALRPHQPQKGRLSLSSAGSRLPRPRATTFKRLSLSTHIA